MDAPDWSPLTLANEFLSGDIVRMLLKYAADPNRVDKRGSIALSHACTKNMDPEIVLEYIAYGADVHLRNGAKWTALQAACHCDHPEIVEVLLQNKADPNAESEKYPIWEALTHPKCMVCGTKVQAFIQDPPFIPFNALLPLLTSPRPYLETFARAWCGHESHSRQSRASRCAQLR